MEYRYYKCCVNFSRHECNKDGGLSDMCDNNIEITRSTFLKHVNRVDLKELETAFGYDRDFHIINDYHVTYHRSKLEGKRVYYLCHSGIEYIFTQQN